MAHLAIKGHATRGNEVIELLKMLGGKNLHKYNADCTSLYFYINENTKNIYYDWLIDSRSPRNDKDLTIFTLEEFIEKFPYKIGDKVTLDKFPCTIKGMSWDCDDIIYYVQGADFSKGVYSKDKDLQPYKEETMEEKDIIKPTAEINLNHPCFDKHNEIELIIPDGWKFKQRGNKMFGVRKQYPKTYDECCKIMKVRCSLLMRNYMPSDTYKIGLIDSFQKLFVCRNAYWKIVGNWEEKRKNKAMHFVIYSTLLGEVVKDTMPNCIANYLLDFPTEEMRDAFYENFKELINKCKELL